MKCESMFVKIHNSVFTGRVYPLRDLNPRMFEKLVYTFNCRHLNSQSSKEETTQPLLRLKRIHGEVPCAQLTYLVFSLRRCSVMTPFVATGN